jgi:hypothetical protein
MTRRQKFALRDLRISADGHPSQPLGCPTVAVEKGGKGGKDGKVEVISEPRSEALLGDLLGAQSGAAAGAVARAAAVGAASKA